MLTFDEETHTYRLDGRVIPSVTQILKSAGVIDDSFYNEEGRVRGTAVHLATQYLDEGDLEWESLDPEIIPYVKAYQKFKEESGFIPELIEKKVFKRADSSRASVIDYAGTLDRAGKFSPDFMPQSRQDFFSSDYCLIDLKTGAAPQWAGAQLAGYAITLLPQMVRRFVLLLKKNGKYKLQEFKNPDDYSVFYGACHVVQGKELIQKYWRTKNGK